MTIEEVLAAREIVWPFTPGPGGRPGTDNVVSVVHSFGRGSR